MLIYSTHPRPPISGICHEIICFKFLCCSGHKRLPFPLSQNNVKCSFIVIVYAEHAFKNNPTFVAVRAYLTIRCAIKELSGWVSKFVFCVFKKKATRCLHVSGLLYGEAAYNMRRDGRQSRGGFWRSAEHVLGP